MAIAFSADYTHGSGGSAASQSLTYVAPSTPSIVFGSIAVVFSTTVTATYGGVSMNVINHTSASGGSGNALYLFYLKNPTAGSATMQFTLTGNSSADFAAWSYTDSAASGTGIDQQNTFSGTTVITETLTPTLTGMWQVSVTTSSGPDANVSANCTKRSGVSAQRDLGVFDSNASLTGGTPNAQAQTISGAGEAVSCTFNIQATGGGIVLPFKSLLGVGI